MTEQQNQPFDTRAFRNACGKFATGITVITVAMQGEVHGMTANAFMSVSLDPPLIVVSVAKKAHMHAFLAESERYAVSILNHEQEAYSGHFAGFPPKDFVPAFVQRHNHPVIANAIAYFVTRRGVAYDAGDHTLYIGEVEYFESNDQDPVLYYGGKYRLLNPVNA
jgi:flavin reductase (DIM6/NTAB) family NADH-FMN oxidoreductase RutF